MPYIKHWPKTSIIPQEKSPSYMFKLWFGFKLNLVDVFFPLSYRPSFGKPSSILNRYRVHSSIVNVRAKCLGRCIAHSSSLPPTESILCRWKVLSRYSEPKTWFLYSWWECPGWPTLPLKGPGAGAYLGWTESFGGILFRSTSSKCSEVQVIWWNQSIIGFLQYNSVPISKIQFSNLL